MDNPLIHKLEQRDTLSDEEKHALNSAIARMVEFQADEDMLREGDRPSECNLLLEGWTGRYSLLGDGRRQISAIHIPGDFVDLHSFPMRQMDHSIGTLTPCKVAVVPHKALYDITREHPHLTRMLWLSTLLDGAILRRWLRNVGRRSAIERLAHLICELYMRLKVVGLAQDHSFRVPVTQNELGDTLGMSTVHINRMLQELRGDGLITWIRDTVTIDDWERLCTLAEFDPIYLNLETEPR